MTRLALAVAFVSLATACSGDDELGTSPPQTSTATVPGTAVTTVTTLPPPPSVTGAQPPSTSATTSTSPPETTSTDPGSGTAAFAMAQLVFGEAPYVVIRNVGSGAGSTDGLWLCQFPDYWPLPDIELGVGEVLAVALGSGPPPEVIGVDFTATAGGEVGTVGRREGELALYEAEAFGDPEAIVDYVEWGSAGHARSGVAVAAGIWVEEAFVPVPPEALALLAGGLPGGGPEGWVAEVGG
ncbi:MAG: hypothetical protein ACE5GC_09990 [Acidimicrobiia bacterium]